MCVLKLKGEGKTDPSLPTRLLLVGREELVPEESILLLLNRKRKRREGIERKIQP